MDSFYSECKKRSRQMTELILIGLIMVLYVIASSWGTKLINYRKGPIPVKEVYPNLLKNKPKDAFDLHDPRNQYVEIKDYQHALVPLPSSQKFGNVYFLYSIDDNHSILVGIDKKEIADKKQKSTNHQTITLLGGFDEMNKQEQKLMEHTAADAPSDLIFRIGYVGDSKINEIIVSMYSAIFLVLLIIFVILLEISGIYQRKIKKQLNALRDDQRSTVDKDFRERLRKNRLGFGDQFLYMSKNWHYEIYPFEDIILLHYHVYRYGDFNRYSLVAWDTSKHHVTLSNTLTKEKLSRYIHLIYERNPEITVEKTTARKNMQLYYFDNLIKEMRDRQEKTKQLQEVKQDACIIHTRLCRRIPIKRRKKKTFVYRKRKSSGVIHTHKNPIFRLKR